MTGALVILAALVVIGLLLFLTDKAYFRHHHDTSAHTTQTTPSSPQASEENPTGRSDDNVFCCGLHLVCEKTGLSPIGDEIVYYDDEELDRFAGREPDSYTPDEKEEFRDVLLTLLPEDVAGWARSITLRKIE